MRAQALRTPRVFAVFLVALTVSMSGIKHALLANVNKFLAIIFWLCIMYSDTSLRKAMNSKFELESKVELPESRYMDFPFAEMKVGQSFIVNDFRVRSAASQWKKRHPGWNYTTRAVGQGKYRLWRTA
jgi:hypothetical protein